MRRNTLLFRALVLAGSSIAFSGCFLWTSRGEGDELSEKAHDHERRLANLERGIVDRQREMNDEVNHAKQKVAELEELLERATKAVTRNSADTGLEVDRLGQELGRLEGEIATLRQEVADRERALQTVREELEQRMQTLAQKAGVDVELQESQIPSNKDEHWQAAFRAYQNSEHALARALFRAYVQRYAQDDHADDAQYYVGSTYLRQDRPASALGELRKVISDYPRSNVLDRTLWDMADAFYKLQACADARGALEALIRGQPRSPLIRQARTKLREESSTHRRATVGAEALARGARPVRPRSGPNRARVRETPLSARR